MMISFLRVLLCGVVVGLSSCATMKVSEFDRSTPVFDPTKFFAGHTSSFGVMENRSGAPKQIVKTNTIGHWEGDTLRIEQDLSLGETKPQHRFWKIHRLDAHHYEATANDILGTARGEAYGNAFHWNFILALSPGNPLANVRMSQWMYLQPDGRTMVNHSTIAKLGIVVAQVTEQFRKR
ncbi:MAG: DUF3833 domain-containing protein [Verrucomicrobiota bacterium]|nr:DUF3833 domain-containing protein [Verrucomicrobiota bacterium]